MKIKKLIAALLSAVTILSCSHIPLSESHSESILGHVTLSAEAADTTITSGGVRYSLYTSGSERLATVTGLSSSLTRTTLTLPLYVTYDGTPYMIRKIGDQAFCGNNYLKTVDLSSSTYLQEIGENAFCSATNLTKITLPSYVVKIGANAFNGAVKLSTINFPPVLSAIGDGAFSNTALTSVSLGASVINISNSAFRYANKIKSYSVSSSNSKYKAVNGVLYDKTGNTLIFYPPMKTATSYKPTSYAISKYAFHYAPNLKSLDISNCPQRNNYYSFRADWDLPELESLTINTSDYRVYCPDGNLQELVNSYSAFFGKSKLLTINGKEIVSAPGGNIEPTFHPEFRQYVWDHFDSMSSPYFMKYYQEKMLEYVVNYTTDSSMTDLEKAVRLHEWICKRVTYDPVEGDTDITNEKNHCLLSVFLHRESDENYYTVCQGYALAYEALLKKAGITAYTISGTSKDGGHAWNYVKINGKFYHIDVTWDDQYYDAKLNFKYYYNHFLRTDSEFTKDGHKAFDWNKHYPYLSISNTLKASADESVDKLGDIDNSGKYDTTDRTLLYNYLYKGASLTNEQKWRADVNMDGYVTRADYTILQSIPNLANVFKNVAYQYEY